MSLIARIKQEQLVHRKARDVKIVPVLTSLLGEAAAIGKNDGNRESTDGEVIAVCKKFIANLQETMSLVKDQTQKDQLALEIAVVSQYLPQQLTEAELITSLEVIVIELGASTMKDMGKVMKTLKERFDGQYDGALASSLIKKRLGS